MFGKFIMLAVLLCALSGGQTFEWVDVFPLDIQTNPAYLRGTTAMDSSGNPVCARLVYYRELYNFNYYGNTEIEKRSPSGSVIWEDTIYGKAEVSELVVDGENNVVCIGTFRDTLAIDTAMIVHSGSGMGSFILKLDAAGNFTWLKDGSEFIPQNGEVTALELKAANNILVGVTNYGINANIYEFNSDGSLVSTILQPEVETISDINVDASGNIWAAGFAFNGQVSFNGLDTIAPFSYNDYVVKYNSSGTAQWVTFIQDITVQFFNIETDNFGNAYLSGNLFDSTSFGNLHANGPQWVYDYFVTKISPDGNFIWLSEIPPGNTMGDATIGNSNFLYCSEEGNTYLTGFFRGEINFGNGVLLNTGSYFDLFVINYNQDGVIQWAKAAGSSNYDQGSSIVADVDGNCYISGLVGENSVFDTITVAGGYRNIFLAKLKTDNIVSVENGFSEVNPLVNEFSLSQNYPNPFNPTTKIHFTIPSRTEYSSVPQIATLKVYDILGNEVAALVDEEKPAGNYEVAFDAGNLPSGVYFYQLIAGSVSETKKMILLR